MTEAYEQLEGVTVGCLGEERQRYEVLFEEMEWLFALKYPFKLKLTLNN